MILYQHTHTNMNHYKNIPPEALALAWMYLQAIGMPGERFLNEVSPMDEALELFNSPK